MEIEETFSSLKEIQTILEKEGMTWRISIDEDETDEEIDDEIENGNNKTEKPKINDLKNVSFSADAGKEEIKKWEEELPDVEENENDKTDENEINENQMSEFNNGNVIEDEEIKKAKIEDASIIYFDLLKNKKYIKTLIFQKEEETLKKEKRYCLIGFCEAPMR